MASLLDIAPLKETVAINGQDVDVYGISAAGVAILLARFPELRKMMTGMHVDEARLMELGEEAIAAIIAAGCGSAGNKQAEDVARHMSVDAQADFLTKILRLTLPNGISAFGDKLTALTAAMRVEGAVSAKALDSKSLK